jgi:hypothetical protein
MTRVVRRFNKRHVSMATLREEFGSRTFAISRRDNAWTDLISD